MATQLPQPARNRRYLLVAVTVAVTITAAAVTAYAQNRGERFPIDIADAKERAAERFANADANEDGDVTLDEFMAAAPERAMAGLRQGRRGPGMDRRGREGPRGERIAATEEAVFEQADGDGDGALSKEEYDGLREARARVAMQRMFERLDDDENGVLAPAELGARVARLESLDANEDGMVTRQEMRGHRWGGDKGG